MSSNSTSPFPNAESPTNLTLITPKPEPIDEPPPPLHLSAASLTHTTSDADVFSEFNRISELFRTAFAHRDGDEDAALPDSDPNSRAIVPVPNPETQAPGVVVAPCSSRKYQTRSSELVRVTGLKADDQNYFRDLIRRTRMLFDSLRVFAVAEEEKQMDPMGHHRKPRGDLKASALMRHGGLWLNRDKRIVGDIPGISVGDVFFYRMELCVVGLHGQPQAGIDYVPASQSSNGEPIATSVIVSGGYEDDEDAGDVIVYTGHGGQDKNHNKQVVHQKLECGNLALERSMNYGIEVRVIRGFKYGGSVSGKVYVYDGLYRIVDTWFDVGKSGFGVFKFKLVRIENQPEMGSAMMKFAESLRTRALEVRPKGYASLDLSKKKENLPVFFYNDIDGDHDPIYYEYLVTTVFPPYVYNSGTSSGCECVDGCRDGCFCAMKNGGEFAYDSNGVLLRGKPLIFECGPHCHCPPTCRNRVGQKGVRNRFEVFRSRETGWGVRSLDLIQAGSFICEYTGVVLTHEQAQIFTMNGDCLVYPRRFGDRWKEWGDLSQIFSDYVCPSYPSVPPLDFSMDVSRMRNVACYMSHSSSPNVFVQHVLYDHNNVSFPHLMLFAMENIPPMRELSLDYGVTDEWMGKLAICH
ncbi:hypothetical protein C2S53_006144 [Perilla frutescens var. hirtella]|uniref:Uncharacterized protein n=1 Tax=Perilla frutescens var. hirtella TaxID=608512 RepID=A0AAD4JJH9_PERFH|nr:hypothetical protein C2S53_006144 [Perilla frutescens var. hirtella]